ncbi:hypothetical protein T484DRAFT_1745923 [Baffinella frigidus]|nr:hypothetical protein T484DRAFT_1745923 [Cryptophyta sp. CCMP2293]
MSDSLVIDGWPVPLDVPGLRVSLSTYRDAEVPAPDFSPFAFHARPGPALVISLTPWCEMQVQVIGGNVQIELRNYSGVLFLTRQEDQTQSVSQSPVKARSCGQAETPSRRGPECASAARTVRKPGGWSGGDASVEDDEETQMEQSGFRGSPSPVHRGASEGARSEGGEKEEADKEEEEEEEVPECVQAVLREVRYNLLRFVRGPS